MSNQQLLRPEFISQLAEHLLQGEHINLIAKHGQGRRQTLQDLQHLLANKMDIHCIDLRRDNIELSTWLKAFAHVTTPTLLMMHNFHCVYDVLVFEQLKNMQHNKNLRFLSVCEIVRNQAPENSNNLILPPLS